MRKYIDLHTHSIKSDGSYTPSELIRYAQKLKLYAVALTDHDNIDGIEEAIREAKKHNVIFIPGIELSCDFPSELHIVGLNIDIKNKTLIEMTKRFKKERKLRNINTIKKLNDIGISVTLDDAKKYCKGNAMGRAHIAKAMIEKGYVSTVKEAFKKYLGKGKPGYSNEFRISVYDALSLIKECNGISILAHCHYLDMKDDEFILFVKDLKAHGLCGLEGYYTEYTKEQSEFYIKVARELDLKISGGTDFHGAMKPDIDLGSGFGDLKIPKEIYDDLFLK